MEEHMMWGPGKVWKTSNDFWTWVRGGLRRSIWMKHPVKLNFRKGKRYKAPIGRNGKEVWVIDCDRCGRQVRQTEAEVNHKIPCGPLKRKEDIQSFAERLAFVTEDDLQMLCKDPCHRVITYTQRYEVTEEQAEKRIGEIDAKKLSKQDKKRKEEIACKKKQKK